MQPSGKGSAAERGGGGGVSLLHNPNNFHTSKISTCSPTIIVVVVIVITSSRSLRSLTYLERVFTVWLIFSWWAEESPSITSWELGRNRPIFRGLVPLTASLEWVLQPTFSSTKRERGGRDG